VTHSTTSPADAGARRPLVRTLAALTAAALAAGSLTLGLAAPASAAVTDSVNGGTFSWKISETYHVHLSTQVATGGATLDAATGTFTFVSGAGSLDIGTGESDISYSGTARAAFANPMTGAEVYALSFTDPRVVVDDDGLGEISADITYSVGTGTPVTTPDVVVTRFDTSDSTDWTRTADAASLTDTPFWQGVLPAGSAEAVALGIPAGQPVDGKAFAQEFLSVLQPSGLMAHFYASGTDANTASNLRKQPAQFAATATFAKPAVIASVTAVSPDQGVTVSVAGDGFRGVTNPGDAGIYVGIAPSGGLPDVSSISNMSSFATATYLPAAALASGTFATTLSATADKFDRSKTYSVYTWQAHAHSNTTQDTETALAIDFSKLDAPPVVTPPDTPIATPPVDQGPEKLTTAVKVKSTRFAKGTKPALTVKVADLSDGSVARGEVRIFVNGKAVKTVKLTKKADGKLVVKLPKKYNKAIEVKAKYLASDTVAAATSHVVKLRLK
jgi:hypothetical protein